MSIRIGERSYDERIDISLQNRYMREAVPAAQEKLTAGKRRAEVELGNWEEWRHLAEQIRAHTIEHLDYYLEQLSDHILSRGGKVHFASTAEEATTYIAEVVERATANSEERKVVKSKSMVTEEIGLNDVLENQGVDVVETDLGEWIIQLDGDSPSHIVAPALHKEREGVRETFSKERDYDGSNDPEALTQFVREQLRKEFLSAQVGITGCNFAVSESGAITLVTNEGNGRLVTSLPDVHIAVMGMERIVPTWEELDVLVSMLTRAAVGQKLSTYVTAVKGPRNEGELDGAKEFHLVIVDNGRSNMLGTKFQSALHCIRCAACIYICMSYRHFGSHASELLYPGPIGAVITPLLDGYEHHHELPYASSLCAACTEACPVNIPLHELLIEHRRVIVEEKGIAPNMEKVMMRGFAAWASHPAAYKLSSKVSRAISSPWVKEEQIERGPGPLKGWTTSRNLRAPTKESFRSWFKKRAD